MIFESPGELTERIEATCGRRIRGRPRITDDTSDYMAVSYGHVVRVGGNDYFILGETHEGRFGISEQPKFWVKKAVDLTSGAIKIIKLNFYEQFTAGKGPFKIKAFRSPEKERDILGLVKGHRNFMQGFSATDAKGNTLRIVDFIRGKTFFTEVLSHQMGHKEYFFTVLPRLLGEVFSAIKAIQFLANKGQHHGDIRNDHIIIEPDTGLYRWIDFDLSVNFGDYDLWSLGNILVYATAQGILTQHQLREHPERLFSSGGSITPGDGLLYYPYRVANLRNVYPYIHPELNRVLVRFSVATDGIYVEYDELLADMEEALKTWPSQ